MTPAPGLVIDGAEHPGEADRYAVHNPARPSEVVLCAPSASSVQLDAAVTAARRSQTAWAELSFAERAENVVAASKAAAADLDGSGVAELLTREHGKVLWESTFDVGTFSGMGGAFAPLVAEALATRVDRHGDGRRTEVEHVPFGVVGVIVPYNWPVSILANKVVPAVLAGNAVVVKCPPTCPGAVLTVASALAGHLPPGLLNVVNGPDAALGKALVAHPGVDMVTFTGGVAAGRSVMAIAAGGPKPVVLELGGNDPAIVAPDLEVDPEVADALVGAAFVTGGQVCMAIKRLYVPADRHAKILDTLVDRLSAEVVGDGLRGGVTMGPVHTRAARDRAESLVVGAEAHGATVHRPATVLDEDVATGGFFVSPAIVDDPPLDSAVVTDEQFAPVLPVIPYGDLDDAVRQANRTPFGLCASIWTGDTDLASSVSARLEAGTVFVNSHGMGAMDHVAPFGGWKTSGIGYELGDEGMAAFSRLRVVRGLTGAGGEGPSSTP